VAVAVLLLVLVHQEVLVADQFMILQVLDHLRAAQELQVKEMMVEYIQIHILDQTMVLLAAAVPVVPAKQEILRLAAQVVPVQHRQLQVLL
jgi:ABC-type microcin C transport system permease subunit YejE